MKNHLHLTALALLSLMTLSIASKAYGEETSAQPSTPRTVEKWDRVVCIQTVESPQNKTGRLCSAFLIAKKERLFLVTAGHASAETTGESRVLYLDPSGQSQWVTLNSLVPVSANPWQCHPASDLAIAELIRREGNSIYLDHFKQLAFDFERLAIDEPARLTPIVSAGFPHGLGTTPKLSAIAVPGHTVSRELPAKTEWGVEPIIFSSPALAQGTSGGPAVQVNKDPNDFKIVGMYIGVMSDQTGGKLSKLVPARIIHQAIESAR